MPGRRKLGRTNEVVRFHDQSFTIERKSPYRRFTAFGQKRAGKHVLRFGRTDGNWRLYEVLHPLGESKSRASSRGYAEHMSKTWKLR